MLVRQTNSLLLRVQCIREARRLSKPIQSQFKPQGWIYYRARNNSSFIVALIGKGVEYEEVSTGSTKLHGLTTQEARLTHFTFPSNTVIIPFPQAHALRCSINRIPTTIGGITWHTQPNNKGCDRKEQKKRHRISWLHLQGSRMPKTAFWLEGGSEQPY